MSEMSESARQRKVLSYVACYILYGLLLVLSYFVIFVIWRRTITELIATFISLERAGPFLYLLSVLLLGIVLFIGVLWAEYYLRTGIQRRQLLSRFVRLAVPLGILGILGQLLQMLG